jgi:hypothetical protein
MPDVQVPGRLVHTNPDGRRVHAQDHGFVEEPRRADEHDLVAGIEHGRHRVRHRGVCAAREEDVVGFEADTELVAQIARGGCGRSLIGEAVREPAAVLWHEPLLKRLDVSRERGNLGIAGHEVAGVGVLEQRPDLHDPSEERLE